MRIGRRSVLAATGAAYFGSRRSFAQPASPVIRIGVLNDESSTYRDNGGPGSVACVRQAVAEYATQAGLNVEVTVGDHQNKPDIGLSIARQWFDQGVDAIADIQGSGIALAINNLVRDRDKVMLAFNVGVSLTTGNCTPNTIQWAYDTYMLTKVASTAVVQRGGKIWYIIRADYAFGKALQDDATSFIIAAGGTVAGGIAEPFPNTDFSSALLQAQSSGAQVVGLANSGDDLVNCVKQAAEFGLTRTGQRLVAFLTFINNVHSLGLQTAQGLLLTESFYWDLNDRTRAFTKRVLSSGFPANMRPNMSQAANYSGTLQYLKAVASLGATEAKRSGAAVVARMKALPADDDGFGSTSIREDGRVMNAAYLFQVKRPDESHGPWDYYNLVATVPPEQAFRPLSEGKCPFVKPQ